MLLFFVYIGLLAFAMLIAQVYVCRGICMHRYMYAQVPSPPPNPLRVLLSKCVAGPHRLACGLRPSEAGRRRRERKREVEEAREVDVVV